MDFRQYLLKFSFPSMSYAHCRAPPSSSVASCPFLLSQPFHKGHSSPPAAPKLPSTSGRTCCPPPSTTASLADSAPFLEQSRRTARGAPTRLRRESGHPSSEAGTAAPGPSHRKPPPPGARAAPRRPRPTRSGPPPLARAATSARPPRPPHRCLLPAPATEAAPNSSPTSAFHRRHSSQVTCPPAVT